MILSFSPVFQKLQVVLQIRRECFRLVVFKNESSGKNQGGFFVVFFCVCGFFLVYFSPSHWLINTCLCIYKSQWNHQGKTFCMYKASWSLSKIPKLVYSLSLTQALMKVHETKSCDWCCQKCQLERRGCMKEEWLMRPDPGSLRFGGTKPMLTPL